MLCTKISFIGYTSGSTFTALDIKGTKWNHSIYLPVQWAEQGTKYTNFQKHFPKAYYYIELFAWFQQSTKIILSSPTE